MVPFAPRSLQAEDYHQHRAELVFYSKANDPFATSTSTVYNSSYNPHWNSGQPHLYPGRYGEHYYQPGPGPQHTTSYLCPTAAGLSAQIPEFPFAPSRGGYTPPHPIYSSSVATHEMKCNHFGFPNYGVDYNFVWQLPPTSHTLADLDISTDAQRHTISPNSTLSSSDIGSVGFNSDEQICIHSTVEPDIIIPDLGQTPSDPFFNGVSFDSLKNETGNKEKETRIKNDSTDQTKTDKDLERRRKNNEASRRSRAQRRDRFLMEIKEVEFLKTENVRLRELLKELELAIKEANDALIAKFH